MAATTTCKDFHSFAPSAAPRRGGSAPVGRLTPACVSQPARNRRHRGGERRTGFDYRFEEANLQRLALISGIFLLSILTGLVGGETLILGPLRALAATTRALQGGDLRARTRLVGVGEVGVLARALDGMAAAVQDRERQLREAREAAEQARQEAEEASQAKSDFLATMSHEIRTPLTGIVGYAELLRNGRLSAQQRRHLDRIDASASALSTVVDDVLNFSRLEAGQVEIEPRPFLLPGLLDNAVSIVRPIADKKGLPINIELDPK